MSYELEPALARRFVRIFEEAGETWKGAGTGFWLAPDLVLTAWHVVEKAHKARRALGVLPDGRAEDPLPARVLWPLEPPGENGLDAALLRLEEGADRLLSHPRLRSTLLGPGQEWRSKGWPVAVPEPYDWADLRGITGALQGDRETLEVYVEGAPKTAEEWWGISGAAAFVAGEWVGVVKESAESWDGERLYLVTSAALLGAPGFRDALALPEGM
ncbi:MAG TPA: serine protease, partial [Thermoanaerobaculia bacterium]|nr:serine protease [Thermoanaerobaculia bacterium]